MTDELTPAVLSIIRGVAGPQRSARIEPDACLERDVRLDALDLVTIACALDEHFGIELPDAEVEGWRLVGDLVGSVRRMRVDA